MNKEQIQTCIDSAKAAKDVLKNHEIDKTARIISGLTEIDMLIYHMTQMLEELDGSK